jgi:type IV pilus assembly protein PilO
MDKMKQWALLTVVAILAVAVGGWFVLISPQRSHASEFKTQTASQESTNTELRNTIAGLQSQHKGLPQVQAQLAKLGVQLPSNPALPALIRALSSAAESAGVDLVSLAPQPPTAVQATTPAPTKPSSSQAAAVASATSSAPAASSSTSTTTAAAGAEQGASLESVGISVVVNGGYFQVEQFVSNLEAMTRPFLTTSIMMAPQAPQAAAATSTAGAATTTASTSTTGASAGYDGHVQATISGQVFMVSGAAAAPSTATK